MQWVTLRKSLLGFLLRANTVSHSSNPVEGFRDMVETGTELLQQFLRHKNLDRSNWAGFTTKNPAFQVRNFGPN